LKPHGGGVWSRRSSSEERPAPQRTGWNSVRGRRKSIQAGWISVLERVKSPDCDTNRYRRVSRAYRYVYRAYRYL
jgi:hypothetical protein